MPVGTVKFFNESKGYGFIAPDGGGQDAFVHITAVERAGMGTLRENQRLAYDLEEDRRGKMAAGNLRSADDAAGDEGATDQAATSQSSNEPEAE
jgi:CspA family cold shock protein